MPVHSTTMPLEKRESTGLPRRRASAIAWLLSVAIGTMQVVPTAAFARSGAPDNDKGGEDEPAAEQRRTEGLRLYEDATAKYDAADYAGAVTSFKSSFDLLGDPRLLYNIAVCYDRLDRFDEALEYFARYRAVADPAEHEDVDRKVASLEKRREAASRDPAAPGPTGEGDRSKRTPAAGTVDERPGDATKRPKVFGPAAWGLLGGTVVAFGLGLGFGLASLKQDREAKSGCPDVGGSRICDDDGAAALKKGRTYGIVADVSLGVGGALAVATIVVLIVNGTRRKRASSSVARITPTFTGIVGRF